MKYIEVTSELVYAAHCESRMKHHILIIRYKGETTKMK
jgi:hypothetical protein